MARQVWVLVITGTRLCVTLRGVEQTRFICHISKSEPDQRRFWGTGYLTKDVEGVQLVDHSGDVIDDDESMAALESAFYDFVKDVRSGDLEHVEFGAASLIEGIIITDEKIKAGLFPAGTPTGMFVGFEANDSVAGDALWEGVKSGRLTALSIVGEGERVAL